MHIYSNISPVEKGISSAKNGDGSLSNCRRVGPRASSTAPDGDSTPKYAREYIPGPTLRGKARVGPAPPSSQLPGQPPPRAEHVGIAAPDRDAALPTATTAAHWARRPLRIRRPRPRRDASRFVSRARAPRRRHGDMPPRHPPPRLSSPRFLFSPPPDPTPSETKPTNATEEAETGGREKGETAARRPPPSSPPIDR